MEIPGGRPPADITAPPAPGLRPPTVPARRGLSTIRPSAANTFSATLSVRPTPGSGPRPSRIPIRCLKCANRVRS